ncbi:hypothetical protein ONZ45_g322 [Pleurotus djamor]|nr:hypothetical protein ONZ45_g322 [Pleurotus djamor]
MRFATFFLLLSCACFAFAHPVVDLGRTEIIGGSLNGQEYFRGIPFAEVPIGKLRFQPPRLKVRLDEKSFNASMFGPGCLQPASSLAPAELSEDCLTLNILRPAGVQKKSRLPVMVWIYGGAFTLGASSTFDAETLVARSIVRGTPTIYVSLNYRVSALGFPAGPDASTVNMLNLGLKDQFTALEWIQKNIHAFGGDPAKVTVFGESAGAISIAYHQLNPKFPKVARAAILQSGSASSASIGPGLRHTSFADFVQAVDCSGKRDAKATLSCLQAVSPDIIRKAIAATTPFNFAPALDGPGGVIPDYPSRLYKKGRFSQVPTLYGTNLDEWTIFTPTTVNSTQQIKDTLSTMFRGPAVTDGVYDRVVDRILQLYPDIPSLGSPFGTGNETFGLSSQFKRMSAIFGDIGFTAPARLQALAFSGAGIRTYGYLFTERHSPLPAHAGVAHGIDIAYVYGNPLPQPAPESARHLSLVMMDYWLSFTSSLHPNDGKGTERLKWVPYTPKTQLLMQLNGNDLGLLKDDFRVERMKYIHENAIALGI